MKQTSSLHENIQRERKITTIQQCTSKSDNNNFLEQMHLDDLIIQDQFKIEESDAENEKEFKTMMPDQTIETSDSKLIPGQESVILNTIKIKQEINSEDENFKKSIIKKMTNNENVIVNDEQNVIGAMLTQADEARTCESTMTLNQKQVHLQKNLIVANNKDNDMLVKSEFYYMKVRDKENVTNFDNKLDSEPPLKKAKTTTYNKSNNSKDTLVIPTTAPS